MSVTTPEKKTGTPAGKSAIFYRSFLYITACVAVVLFVAGLLTGRLLYDRPAPVVEPPAQSTEEPKEDPEPVITTEIVKEQLKPASDLVSLEYDYTNMGSFENHVDFYGWKVPFTTKSFIVSYEGVILAGIDMDKCEIEVDNSKRTISITLPESKILSHEIHEDSLQVLDETHNIFNPIQIEDYNGFTADQKETVESSAIEKGLLTNATEKARTAIKSLLAPLPGMDRYTLTVT